jgi:hypothetical protein
MSALGAVLRSFFVESRDEHLLHHWRRGGRCGCSWLFGLRIRPPSSPFHFFRRAKAWPWHPRVPGSALRAAPFSCEKMCRLPKNSWMARPSLAMTGVESASERGIETSPPRIPQKYLPIDREVGKQRQAGGAHDAGVAAAYGAAHAGSPASRKGSRTWFRSSALTNGQSAAIARIVSVPLSLRALAISFLASDIFPSFT